MIPRLRRYLSLHYRCKNSSRRGVNRSFAKEDNALYMSHQRECSRAYHEYRKLFRDVCVALSGYSDEWKYLVENYFMPKCEYLGKCSEKKGCGRYEKG